MQNNKKVDHWVTINGNHVPIYDGETEEDVKKRLDDWNNQNSKKSSYADIESKGKMVSKFMEDTDIIVDGEVESKCPHDTLATMLDTLSELKDKYGKELGVSWLSYVDDNVDGQQDNVYADFKLGGKLRVNLKYFGRDKNTIQEVYDAGGEHNVKAADAVQAIIAHECGHGRMANALNNIIYDQVKKKGITWNYDDYVTAWNWLGDDTKQGNSITSEIYGRFHAIEEKLNNDIEVQKKWGGESTPKSPNMSIRGFANPMFSWKGMEVSKYAATNYHELLAESFCDVECNGAQASRVSKEVYDAFYKN